MSILSNGIFQLEGQWYQSCYGGLLEVYLDQGQLNISRVLQSSVLLSKVLSNPLDLESEERHSTPHVMRTVVITTSPLLLAVCTACTQFISNGY